MNNLRILRDSRGSPLEVKMGHSCKDEGCASLNGLTNITHKVCIICGNNIPKYDCKGVLFGIKRTTCSNTCKFHTRNLKNKKRGW